MWIDGHYVGGEAMGWQSVRNKLCGKIDSVLEGVKTESAHVEEKAAVPA